MAEMVHGARNDTKSQNCIYLMCSDQTHFRFWNFPILKYLYKLYSVGVSKNLNSHLIWDRSVCLFLSFSPPNPYWPTWATTPTWASWPMSSQGLPCAHLPSLCRRTGMIATHYCSASSCKVGSGDSNSGLQACMMSALPHWAISPWPFQSISAFIFSN